MRRPGKGGQGGGSLMVSVGNRVGHEQDALNPAVGGNLRTVQTLT